MRNEMDRDEILLDLRCKLSRFSKADNEWKDVGKGSLRITKDPDNGKQRILVRNELGKPTLNCNLIAGMKFERKKNGIYFVAPLVDNAGKVDFTKVLIKLNSEEIDPALSKLEAGVPSK